MWSCLLHTDKESVLQQQKNDTTVIINILVLPGIAD